MHFKPYYLNVRYLSLLLLSFVVTCHGVIKIKKATCDEDLPIVLNSYTFNSTDTSEGDQIFIVANVSYNEVYANRHNIRRLQEDDDESKDSQDEGDGQDEADGQEDGETDPEKMSFPVEIVTSYAINFKKPFYSKEEVSYLDLCDATSIDGYDCPSSGNYLLKIEFNLLNETWYKSGLDFDALFAINRYGYDKVLGDCKATFVIESVTFINPILAAAITVLGIGAAIYGVSSHFRKKARKKQDEKQHDLLYYGPDVESRKQPVKETIRWPKGTTQQNYPYEKDYESDGTLTTDSGYH